jgi:transcriptional antiterminator NusG
VSDGAELYVGMKMTSPAPAKAFHRAEINSGAVALPASSLASRWYAAYTCANHEKRVAAELGARDVGHFLPLYSCVRRWKDRRVTLDLPLFPGYVFVRLALSDRLRVLQIPSVVRLVGINGHPEPLPDDEIEALRNGLAHRLRAEPHPHLAVGRRVRMVRGPFKGIEGILVRKKGALRLILSINAIMRSAAVEVDVADVEPIGRTKQESCLAGSMAWPPDSPTRV